MILESEQLEKIFKREADLLEVWACYLNMFLGEYQVNTKARMAAFLAQTGHESGGYRTIEENLNYSADSLERVFGKYFSAEVPAAGYHRLPEKIASRVYGARMGNGDEASGEGWKYRGRGIIQITGKNNYRDCGAALELDLVDNPDRLLQPRYAMQSAFWFWDVRKLNGYADAGDFEKITRRINGGLNGHDHRVELHERALEVL